MKGYSTSFVYLIQCGDLPYYKIGVSDRPEERLMGLQTANPQTLSLLATCAFDNKNLAVQAEQDAHKKLWKEHIRGEWFELNPEQVMTLKCDMIRASG